MARQDRKTLWLKPKEYNVFLRIMREVYFYSDAPAEYYDRTGEQPPDAFIVMCIAKARLLYIELLNKHFGKSVADFLAQNKLCVKLLRDDASTNESRTTKSRADKR